MCLEERRYLVCKIRALHLPLHGWCSGELGRGMKESCGGACGDGVAYILISLWELLGDSALKARLGIRRLRV